MSATLTAREFPAPASANAAQEMIHALNIQRVSASDTDNERIAVQVFVLVNKEI